MLLLEIYVETADIDPVSSGKMAQHENVTHKIRYLSTSFFGFSFLLCIFISYMRPFLQKPGLSRDSISRVFV